MANLIYPKYKEAILNGAANVDLVAGNVKVALVDTALYTYAATDQFYNIISGSAIVGTPQSIAATKTVTNGLFTSTTLSVTFTGVTGATVESLVLYIDTGTPATSRLVVYFDTATGLTLTPNGGNVTVTFNGSGIFQL